MRIIRTAAAVAAATALLTAAMIQSSSAGAVRLAADSQPSGSCTPAWHLVPTPHDLATVGSASVPGMLGSAGSVAVVSPHDVWFPFGDFDTDYAPGYPSAWTGRWDGQSITTPPQIPSFIGTHLTGSGSSFDSAGDGWLLVNSTRGGYGGIYNYAEHWRGGQWTLTQFGLDPGFAKTQAQPVLAGVAALSPADAWAVGTMAGFATEANGAAIEHWDGSQWTIVPNPLQGTAGSKLSSVTAISARDIWAVGAQISADASQRQPIAEHWDGVSWTVVPTAPSTSGAPWASFDTVSASGGQVWAVGFQGAASGAGGLLIERFDGTSWQQVTGPDSVATTSDLATSVYAAAGNDIWISISHTARVGELVHFDGSSWTATRAPGLPESGLAYSYAGIGGTGPHDIWLAGTLFDADQPDLSRNVTEAIAHYTC